MTAIHRSVAAAIVIAFTTAQLTGCMAFQSNSARKFSSFPPPEVAPLSESVRLHFETTFQVVGLSITNDRRQSAVDNINGWAEDIFEQTGVFRIHPDADTADYRLVIRVRDNANPTNVGMAILTGVTLYLIPSKSSDTYITDMELINAQGERVANKRYEHQVTLWQQLFLIFGAPFATLNSVSMRMFREVLKDAAIWSAEHVVADLKW